MLLELTNTLDLIPLDVPTVIDLPPRSYIVVRTKPGDFARVFINQCQHLPVRLDAKGDVISRDGLIECKTHGAKYTLEGECVMGPCFGQWLKEVPANTEGNRVMIDVDDAITPLRVLKR